MFFISPFNQFLKNKRINFSASTNPICQCNTCMNKVKSNKCTVSVREYWNWRRNSKLEFVGKLNFVPLNSNYTCQIEFSWISSFVLQFFFFSISRVLFPSKPPGSRHTACDCLAGFCFRVKTILEMKSISILIFTSSFLSRGQTES